VIARGALLRYGAGGAVLLAAGGCAASSPPDAMLRAVARTMLSGALPDNGAALDDAVAGVHTAIAGLPPAVQGEIGQLFGLLQFPLTRRIFAGVPPWERASDTDVAAFLQRWRTSRAALMRSGYQALHQLVMAAWYGQDEAWTRIGYAGPPRIA
jgi:hypothetical protein